MIYLWTSFHIRSLMVKIATTWIGILFQEMHLRFEFQSTKRSESLATFLHRKCLSSQDGTYCWIIKSIYLLRLGGIKSTIGYSRLASILWIWIILKCKVVEICNLRPIIHFYYFYYLACQFIELTAPFGKTWVKFRLFDTP